MTVIFPDPDSLKLISLAYNLIHVFHAINQSIPKLLIYVLASMKFQQPNDLILMLITLLIKVFISLLIQGVLVQMISFDQVMLLDMFLKWWCLMR